MYDESVKVSGRRGKKDSMEIDWIPHLLDIHLDRGVINEGASARVRFEQTRNHCLCLQIEDLTFARIRLFRSSSSNTQHGSFTALPDIRRLDSDQNEGDSARILVIHSMFKAREGRVGSKSFFKFLHSNTNITEASSQHVMKRPMKL